MALLAAAAPPAWSQRTSDEARLTIGAGLLHWSGGGRLWRVAGQPILTGAGADTLALARDLTNGFGVTFSGAYFPGRYWGVGAEVLVARLGTSNQCRLVQSEGSSFSDQVCSSLDNSESSSTTAIFAGTVLLRPGFRGVFQPYARVSGGLAFVSRSLITTTGSTLAQSTVIVYPGSKGSNFSPYWGAGLGFAAALGQGYQIRWEVRDNALRLPRVKRPSSQQGIDPEVETRSRHGLSFSVTVDIVLERKRGRRY